MLQHLGLFQALAGDTLLRRGLNGQRLGSRSQTPAIAEALVDGHPVEPCRECGVSPKAAQSGEYPQENLLGEIVRFARARQTNREPVDRSMKSLVQFSLREAVPTPAAHQDLIEVGLDG